MIHNFSFGDSNLPVGSISTSASSLTDTNDVSNNGFNVDDPGSPDFGFVSGVINDLFRKAASTVDVLARTNNGDLNETFDEDADPTYWNPEQMDAFFVPAPMEFELTKWGLDSKNKMEITFLRSDLFNLFDSRLLRPGDLVNVKYGSISKFRPGLYRVVNSQETGNYRYQWFYVTVQVELTPGDITTLPAGNDVSINDYPLGL